MYEMQNIYLKIKIRLTISKLWFKSIYLIIIIIIKHKEFPAITFTIQATSYGRKTNNCLIMKLLTETNFNIWR